MKRNETRYVFIAFFQLMIFILFLPAILIAQDSYTIEGKVVDSKTNEPLAFVSVYLSQTSFGVMSDEQGVYVIKKIPAGSYTLVASLIGYKPEITNVTLDASEKITVNIKMQPTVYEYNTVEVTGEKADKWNEQFKYFRKFFIGENEFADKCIILNKYKIDFVEDNDKLIARVNEPLKVHNAALGYDIECVLYYFKYDKNFHTTSYQVFPRFIEKDSLPQDSVEYFLKNRTNAYKGSIAHFLTSLVKNNFNNEGFTLRIHESIAYESQAYVTDASKIMYVDPVLHKYYLRFKGFLKVEYNDSHKGQETLIVLPFGETEFSPNGFFLHTDEFVIDGDLAKGGVACMLPRFWK